MNKQLPPVLFQLLGVAIAIVAVIVWLHSGHASYPITSLALALMLGGRVVSTLGLSKEDPDQYRVPPSLPHRKERREIEEESENDEEQTEARPMLPKVKEEAV